jgi:hypothetical protein
MMNLTCYHAFCMDPSCTISKLKYGASKVAKDSNTYKPNF